MNDNTACTITFFIIAMCILAGCKEIINESSKERDQRHEEKMKWMELQISLNKETKQ